MLHSSVRRSLGYSAEFGRGRILPLGKSVDSVVEEQDIDVYIAPDGVYEMIASYRKGIAVSAHLPHSKGGVGDLDAGTDGGGASVDGMESVGIHIIRKSGRTSYPGDHHITLLGVIESLTHLGQSPLQCGEDGVVSASGTPACLFLAFEIICRKYCHSYQCLLKILEILAYSLRKLMYEERLALDFVALTILVMWQHSAQIAGELSRIKLTHKYFLIA